MKVMISGTITNIPDKKYRLKAVFNLSLIGITVIRNSIFVNRNSVIISIYLTLQTGAKLADFGALSNYFLFRNQVRSPFQI